MPKEKCQFCDKTIIVTDAGKSKYKKVECLHCHEYMCFTCFQDYVMNKDIENESLDIKCPSCHKLYSEEFITTNLGTQARFTSYNEMMKEVYFVRENALLRELSYYNDIQVKLKMMIKGMDMVSERLKKEIKVIQDDLRDKNLDLRIIKDREYLEMEKWLTTNTKCYTVNSVNIAKYLKLQEIKAKYNDEMKLFEQTDINPLRERLRDLELKEKDIRTQYEIKFKTLQDYVNAKDLDSEAESQITIADYKYAFERGIEIQHFTSLEIPEENKLEENKGEHKKVDKSINVPCPNNNCTAFLCKWKCSVCDIDVCYQCRTIKNKTDKHVCKEEDLETIRLINSTTKKCPNEKCTAMIEKNLGCQVMFCTRCKTSFNWKTMRILGEKDNRHNEYFIQHMANLNKNTNPGNRNTRLTSDIVNCEYGYIFNSTKSIQIENNLKRNGIKTLIDGKEFFTTFHIINERVGEFHNILTEQNGENKDAELRKYRVLRYNNLISKEQWKSTILSIEKKYEYANERKNIASVFCIILTQCLDELSKCNIEDAPAIVKRIENYRIHHNKLVYKKIALHKNAPARGRSYMRNDDDVGFINQRDNDNYYRYNKTSINHMFLTPEYVKTNKYYNINSILFKPWKKLSVLTILPEITTVAGPLPSLTLDTSIFRQFF